MTTAKRGRVVARAYVIRCMFGGRALWVTIDRERLASGRYTPTGWSERREEAWEQSSKVDAFDLAKMVGGKVYRRGRRATVPDDDSFIVPCTVDGLNVLANAMFARRSK